MYQLAKNEKVKVESIQNILLCKDMDLNVFSFIFLKNTEGWLQVYVDEGVLFIQKLLDIDFDGYLEDLSQYVVFQCNFDNEEDLIVDFSFENSSAIFILLSTILSIRFQYNSIISAQLQYCFKEK